MTLLLPRLPGPACDNIVRSFLAASPTRWAGFRPDRLPDQVRFAATGGTPVDAASLARLRRDLVAMAERHGFGRDGFRPSLAAFDAEAAVWLAQSDLFATGEALRDDVWAFVTAFVAPDIVHWRFGGSVERFAGGVRNTFQRLWMRGVALDRGAGHQERWLLLEELTEDALVQMTERPSIGGDSVLALAVAEAWLRAARHHGKSAMEDIMRQAILRIRVRNEIRSLADLPAVELACFLDGVFGVPEFSSSPHVEQSDNAVIRDAPASLSSAQYEQASAFEQAISDAGSPFAAAADRISREAGRRGWLSPRSQFTLEALRYGRTSLERGERNALDYLLGRLSDAGLLKEDIAQLRSALSEDFAASRAGP
jgi:hypothetical protein